MTSILQIKLGCFSVSHTYVRHSKILTQGVVLPLGATGILITSDDARQKGLFSIQVGGFV